MVKGHKLIYLKGLTLDLEGKKEWLGSIGFVRLLKGIRKEPYTVSLTFHRIGRLAKRFCERLRILRCIREERFAATWLRV